MQPRGLEYKDISNKCGFYLMSTKPEKNLNLLPVDVKTAYVFYDDDLYFIDKDAETKCVYVKLDATRKKKLKADLQLANIEPLKKEEKCRALIPELSSEQLESISMTTGHYPSWLHRIILLNRKATELQQQSWEFEEKFRELEKRIAKLEESCTKKFTPKDLEELYPAEYKKTPARPTDYKEVKLKELRKRLELLSAGENKEALKSASEEISLIASQLNTDAPAYLDALKKYQDLDKELSDFSKNELTQDNVRTKVRSDINKLPLNLRIAAISIMPGATSMGALMDLLRHLKQLYEQEMHKAFVAITEKKLKKETFEENFKEYFKEELKEYFKKVAKRPTHEMANIKDEIERIISEFWKKFEIRNADRLNECNAYLRTIIYLSCTLETFRFTDKVQRLDIASAVSGKIGSLFGGEDIAGEFLDKLTVTQIENSFAMMPHASGLMTAIPNTERLWLEVAIWLRGLHQRSYDQISPFFKDNGVVKAAVVQHCGDDDDRNFFKFKGMVKWLLAQYHESHYQTLLLLLPPEVCNDLLPLLPPAFVGQYKKKNNLEPVQQEVVVASVEVTTDKKEGVDKKDKDEKNEGVPKEDKKVEPEKRLPILVRWLICSSQLNCPQDDF